MHLAEIYRSSYGGGGKSARKQIERGHLGWFPQMRGSMVTEKAGGEGHRLHGTEGFWSIC